MQNNNNDNNCNGLVTLIMSITITINYKLSDAKLLTVIVHLTELIMLRGRWKQEYMLLVGVLEALVLKWIDSHLLPTDDTRER